MVFSMGSAAGAQNNRNESGFPKTGERMEFWKKMYFGTACVAAVFLAISLF